MLQIRKAVKDNQWGSAFRTPGLIRFVNQEQAYLSTANDGPHMFVNIEDYLSRPGHPNAAFQVRNPTLQTVGLLVAAAAALAIIFILPCGVNP